MQDPNSRDVENAEKGRVANISFAIAKEIQIVDGWILLYLAKACSSYDRLSGSPFLKDEVSILNHIFDGLLTMRGTIRVTIGVTTMTRVTIYQH